MDVGFFATAFLNGAQQGSAASDFGFFIRKFLSDQHWNQRSTGSFKIFYSHSSTNRPSIRLLANKPYQAKRRPIPDTMIFRGKVTLVKLFFCLFIFLPAGVAAQVSVSGRVVNQADNKPIPDASVFFNNSSVGVKTAADGAFLLNNVKPGKYDLVISVVGFQTYSQPITAENGKLDLPVILLSPKTIALSEVSVKYIPDPNRDKYYSRFKDEFLGTSWRAADCKIMNPEMLDLAYNDTLKTLTASSEDFLKVENDALGYKIKYLLKGFSKNTFAPAAQKVQFNGSVLFEEMSGTTGQQKRWQKRRLDVYEGSLMHFLRCVLNNTFEDAGFQVYRMLNSPDPQRPADSVISAKVKLFQQLAKRSEKYADSLNYWQQKASAPAFTQIRDPKALKQGDLVKLTGEKGLYALSGKAGSLLVVYYKNHNINSEKPGELYDPLAKFNTIINFNNTNAFFDRNGKITDPAAISLDGSWANYRLAELLPVDYDPSANGQQDTAKTANLFATEAKTADDDSLKNSLLALKAKSDSTGIKLIPEKLYLQFDKPYYAIGDTIWFKAYLLNNFLTASDKSGMLNIDIANDSNKVVRQYRFQVRGGLTWGNFSLDKSFRPGAYTLRAYTRWMRNFGDDAFFYKTFDITGAIETQLLAGVSFNNSNNNSSITANLRFSTMSEMPFAVQPVTLQVINDGKRLYRQKYLTGVDGGLNVNFNLPPKQINLAIVAENDKRERLAVIPVTVNTPQNADVQFLPEGGSLVAGLPVRVGFKAIGEDGRGLDISGIIIDHSQKQVAAFQSLHKGIGSFDLEVKQGESYTAQVTLPGGAVKQYALPAITSMGTTLAVKNEMDSDSLVVTAATCGGVSASGKSYFIVGRARGIVCYAAIVNFHASNSVSKKVAKSLFPGGIVHFTLMTPAYQPLNERLVFIDRHDNLRINVLTDKTVYGKRDSINMKLKVTDADGAPVSGDFSMVVTDNAQVKPDTLDEVNIETRLLLTADLKGYVEQPAYYLSAKTAATWQSLDNLLLTQGWAGYHWDQVTHPPALPFQPERDFVVTGHVTNVLNKPVAGTDIMLFSKSPSILIDTVTDKNGKFIFDRLPRVDTPVFILRAVNRRGKSFNVNVSPEEIPAPAFNAPTSPLLMPWYVNIDDALKNFTKNAALTHQQEQNFEARGRLLKEVKITAKKIVKGSQNLNGSGNADLVLDEKDLEAQGKKTWLQVLEERIGGFKEGYLKGVGLWTFIQDIKDEVDLNGLPTSYNFHWFFIHDKAVKIYVDGISITEEYQGRRPQILTFPEEGYSIMKGFLNSTVTEDIKGIELNFTDKYSATYLAHFAGSNIIPMDAIAFIEITTRSGHGPVTDNTPGMYLYKPLPISWPAAFYKPKYTVNDTLKNHLDLRSTIDWEPNIVTDANGEARVGFYTADQFSTYTVTIEGTDMNGRLGYLRRQIKVAVDKERTK